MGADYYILKPRLNILAQRLRQMATEVFLPKAKREGNKRIRCPGNSDYAERNSRSY